MRFKQNFNRLDLQGNWQFNYSENNPAISSIADLQREFDSVLPAKVPGNFELDLFDNNIIPDPYYGKNIKILRNYENMNIWYYRTFEVNLNDNSDPYLVFEGLDCLADIYLNGEKIASYENMLISHELLVSNTLKNGNNEIVVHIKPTSEEALKQDYPLLVSGFSMNYQSLYLRKAPHMFGWDILPRIISAGIFRPVYIEFRTPVRFLECYLQTTCLNHGSAEEIFFYKCNFTMNPEDSWSIRLTGTCGASVFTEEFRLSFQYGKYLFNLNKPLLWNVRGRGSQNIYKIRAELLNDNRLFSIITFTHGIRTINLSRTAVLNSEDKGEFVFVVNGERIFTKGTNWVPADAFHSRDARRIPRMLEMASDINCNIIRCWGGNLYEDDLFFEICDKEGILVWQDFAMACAVYPQDIAFQDKLKEEAASVIKRLRQHPCLALWAGDNECDQAYSWFGFDANPNTNVLTRGVLPESVRLHDPFRDYLPSSPYIDPPSYGKGDSFLPENHLWGKRDYFKSDYYAKSTCRFASEMGYHGCPSPESIRKFISKESIWPYDNEEWLLHSTSPLPEIDDRYNFRVQLMANQIEVLFGYIPDNIDEFSKASQISQGEAKKFFIELFRGGKWARTGIIWWNLIDGWPQFSDAVTDYYFNKKIAYDFIKRSQRDMLMMFREPADDILELVACNDTRSDAKIDFIVSDAYTGKKTVVFSINSTADSVTSAYSIKIKKNEQIFYIIEWTDSTGTGLNHYLSGCPPYNLNWYLKCLSVLNNKYFALGNLLP